MRIRTALAISLATLSVALCVAPVARAQSFFQKLFGAGTSLNAGPQPMPRMRAVIPQHRFQSRAFARPQSRRHMIEADEDVIGPPDSGGPYKTMCVRTCDGFYFPVRHNARRKNFASDVKSCRNACGSQGKLFYYPLRDAEGPDTMVDLDGRKYAETATAFAYRKKLAGGCACKPDPWSYEEARRHQSYADQQALELAEAADVQDETPSVAASEPAPPDDPFAGDAFTRATASSQASEGSIDLAAELYVTVGKADAQTVDAPAAATGSETARIDRVVPQRAWRRRSRGVLHRTSYGYGPATALRTRSHTP